MDEIPVLNSDGPVQSIQIDVMPEIPKSIVTSPPQANIKIEKTNQLTSHLIYYLQGDEEAMQDAMLDFFSKNPKIIYSTTWTVGIATYFMFIYR
jgi:DNA repair protein RadC